MNKLVRFSKVFKRRVFFYTGYSWYWSIKNYEPKNMVDWMRLIFNFPAVLFGLLFLTTRDTFTEYLKK